ncbi:MAG TPA: peptidoglycan DD-metalloendopeptidase family protein [Mucilaginibacter sp.]
MDSHDKFAAYIETHCNALGKVVDVVPGHRLYQFDLTSENKELNAATISDSGKFNNWINKKLSDNNCIYGIGGYMEHRTIYAGIPLFDNGKDEPRFLHLGIDIWAPAGTVVYSPLQGKVHSFRDNNNFGDYGPTIILEHNLAGLQLYSLYGHLSRPNLATLQVGMPVETNQKIGNFGDVDENGHWPPHLHFQLMFDMEGNKGDYPGACRYSEKEKYLKNIPDPQSILRFPETVNR